MLPKTSASSTLQNKEIDFTDSKVPSTFNSVGFLALLIFEAKEAVLGYTLTFHFFLNTLFAPIPRYFTLK